MDGERPRPPRRKRLDGTILFGGVLSALLHATGIALLLMAPTRLQPLEPTAYTVEVLDPAALGGELLAGPIGGRQAPPPPPAPEPEPAAPPAPKEPERVAKAVLPEPEADAVPLETVRPTPRARPTARATVRATARATAQPTPQPRPSATKIVAAPVRKPEAQQTAAPAPKQVAAAKTPSEKPVAPAATPGRRAVAPAPAADGTDRPDGAADGDLDNRLSAAIAGLEGKRGAAGGLGGAAPAPTGPPGVGGDGPGGGGQVRGLEFVAYYTQMLARIKERWSWVGERADLRVTVRFSILPSGDVANLRLVERSGSATYDASVQRAIKSASPFAPPPEAYHRDFADVELTFRPADLEVSG